MIAKQYDKGLSNCDFNSNYSVTPDLINYWGFNGNFNDSIGDAHLFGGKNFSLTSNRFNRSYSALSLRDGYLEMPPGVYFNSSFTAMSWINIKIFTSWARIFDIGIGQANQNVFLCYSNGISGIPQGYTMVDYNFTNCNSLSPLNLNKWQHLAFVLDNQNAYIYIDGIQTGFQSLFLKPKNVVRTTGFIGRSNWNDDLANADFDEIKFFNRALTEQEIISEMANDFCL